MTNNTDWQIVDRFARSLGVRDPVIDTYFSMQDKYVGEGRSMYASWPQSICFWDEAATTVVAPERTVVSDSALRDFALTWGITMTRDGYAQLLKELEGTDIEIKEAEPIKQYIGTLYGIRTWWEDNM